MDEVIKIFIDIIFKTDSIDHKCLDYDAIFSLWFYWWHVNISSGHGCSVNSQQTIY